MVDAAAFLSRLITATLNRDGQARALEPPPAAPVQAKEHGLASPDPAATIRQTIGAKVLDVWLQDRRAASLPDRLRFGSLDEAQVALLLQVMAAAADADGRFDASERRQVRFALGLAGGGEARQRMFEAVVDQPRPLAALLREVAAADLAAHAYAVSLLAINQRSVVNQLYLAYLAERLGLEPGVVTGLRRRYRA